MVEFTINEIKFWVEPCSVGLTPQGEITAKGAVRMIRERKLRDLKILDICCGVGIIGLTIYSTLRNESIIKETVFSDINIFNLNSLHKTLSINKLNTLLDNKIRTYLSDGLNHIPKDEKFDIIVSNPPHLFGKSFSKEDTPLTPNRLGTYDPDWNFHRDFYRQCHDFLRENGEIWFLENGRYSSENDFLPLIEKNANLKFVQKITEPLDPRFFWLITKRLIR